MSVRRRATGLLGFGIFLGLAIYVSGFDPGTLIAGLPKISDFPSGLVPPLRWATLWNDLASWYWAPGKWLRLLWVTIMIALIGTAIGTLLGGVMSFFAARNLGAKPATAFVVRRVLEIARTVPDLVWALVFLFAFGLGPLAGALAIVVHTLGAQGKLFAEVNENADLGALEGVRASGGTWADEIALIGAVLALTLAIVCSRTAFPIRILQFGFRRFADGLRSFDHLIWALVFVRAIGLGPMAGILAIAIVDLGTLAKLYSEAIDNASKKPVEGVRASGGTWIDGLRLGVLPQVLPNLLSSTLYMWESNTRSATVLGIVGAGGIGYQLADRLRVYEFGEASLMIILIIAAVFAIDALSARIRAMLIAGR